MERSVMGLYINKGPNGADLPTQGKAAFIRGIDGVKSLSRAPDRFVPNLVCVVENNFFDAAAYCDSEQEMLEFAWPDGRRKHWFIVPNAAKLAR
jgi:hypothetical protein